MENSFSNLILKYVPEEEIRYLESVLGSIDAFNNFTNEAQVKSVINDFSYLDDFFTIIHNFYHELEKSTRRSRILNSLSGSTSHSRLYDDEGFEVSENIMLALKLFENHYNKLKSFSPIKVMHESDKFSLDEEFNLEEGRKYQYGLNAVTVITPSYTFSRFNDNSENGLEGFEHYDENILEIIRAVYGENARNICETGQDIIIRYINKAYKNLQEPFMMTVEIPSKINSSQKTSLQNLNDEIKKFETRTGQKIVIHSSIIDYEDNRKITDVVEDDENLDAILSKVVVNDSINLKYQELHEFYLHKNDRNHFNDSNYRLTHTISGPKEDDLGIYNFFTSRYSNDEEIRRIKYGKMAGIITTKQVAFKFFSTSGDGGGHFELMNELQREIFPTRNYEVVYNEYEDGVLIFGTSHDDINIFLPDTITIEQYKCIEKIVEEFERSIRDYPELKLKSQHLKDILKKAKTIITNKQILDNDEVIVGVPLKKIAREKTEEDRLMNEVYESGKRQEEHSQLKILSAIDADIDDMGIQERKILNAKHFTSVQKKKMIEELRQEFDEYTEENLEKGGRKI